MELLYFGDSWPAPERSDVTQVPTPVGELCFRCQEMIEQGQQGYLIPYIPAEGEPRMEPWHRRCFAREIGLGT